MTRLGLVARCGVPIRVLRWRYLQLGWRADGVSGDGRAGVTPCGLVAQGLLWRRQRRRQHVRGEDPDRERDVPPAVAGPPRPPRLSHRRRPGPPPRPRRT